MISPLLSLMSDQVASLQRIGVASCAVTGSTSTHDQLAIWQAAAEGTMKLIYMSPEKLQNKSILNKLEQLNERNRLSRLIIDEAHCCSQWGHDFRSDYKNLNILKLQFGNIPILALTATATSKVEQDVSNILNLKNCLTFRSSFNRPNLFYEVLPKKENFVESVQQIVDFIDRSKLNGKSGIVYCLTCKEADEVATELSKLGIRARSYHAQLENSNRESVQRNWMENSIEIVVGTIAFGLGINKLDVRFVVHHSISKSIEGFYQESGRAGRDGELARCLVLYRVADITRNSSMVFHLRNGLASLYALADLIDELTLCRRVGLAAYFDELFDRSQCNAMCDNCKASREVHEQDVTQLAAAILRIFNELDVCWFRDLRFRSVCTRVARISH